MLALDRNKLAQLKGYKFPPAAAHAVLQVHASASVLASVNPCIHVRIVAKARHSRSL